MLMCPNGLRPGRWHVVLGSERLMDEWGRIPPLGWRCFHFAVFYLHEVPPDGEPLGRPYFRGFWLQLRYWLPFEFVRTQHGGDRGQGEEPLAARAADEEFAAR